MTLKEHAEWMAKQGQKIQDILNENCNYSSNTHQTNGTEGND